MSFARVKCKMVSLKTSLSMDSKLQPADAMLLMNEAWSTSFANVNANKRAICDRGWLPFNRILLHHPDIRATMTDEEKKLEKEQSWFSECMNDSIDNNANNAPSMNEQYLPTPAAQNNTKLNFSNGCSATCLETLIQYNDLHQARECINKRKNAGTTIKERLSKF